MNLLFLIPNLKFILHISAKNAQFWVFLFKCNYIQWNNIQRYIIPNICKINNRLGHRDKPVRLVLSRSNRNVWLSYLCTTYLHTLFKNIKLILRSRCNILFVNNIICLFCIFSDNYSYLVFKPAFGPMYLGPELITCSCS